LNEVMIMIQNNVFPLDYTNQKRVSVTKVLTLLLSTFRMILFPKC